MLKFNFLHILFKPFILLARFNDEFNAELDSATNQNNESVNNPLLIKSKLNKITNLKNALKL